MRFKQDFFAAMWIRVGTEMMGWGAWMLRIKGIDCTQRLQERGGRLFRCFI